MFWALIPPINFQWIQQEQKQNGCSCRSIGLGIYSFFGFGQINVFGQYMKLARLNFNEVLNANCLLKVISLEAGQGIRSFSHHLTARS